MSEPSHLVKNDEALEHLTKVLNIQKNKLLLALYKTTEITFKDEDEAIVERVKEELESTEGAASSSVLIRSLQWDDCTARGSVRRTLAKHAFYGRKKYLYCAKLIFIAYSGYYTEDMNIIYFAMEYVLTHARQFGNPKKPVFQIIRSLRPSYNPLKSLELPKLPESHFMKKISELIENLEISPKNETEYMSLNVNTTYFALQLLKNILTGDLSQLSQCEQIQENYHELCPRPLATQVPLCLCNTQKFDIKSLLNSACLVLEAYLVTNDNKTKTVLRQTCVQYFEWYGMQLPYLFAKVCELYKLEVDELWDYVMFEDTAALSLINFAQNYFELYEKLKKDQRATAVLFPFCRALSLDYHTSLSARENLKLCIVLATLVDLKIGLEKSTVRLSPWAKDAACLEQCEQSARDLYELLNALCEDRSESMEQKKELNTTQNCQQKNKQTKKCKNKLSNTRVTK